MAPIGTRSLYREESVDTMGKNINRVVTAPEEGLGANAYLFIQYESNDSQKSFNSSWAGKRKSVQL